MKKYIQIAMSATLFMTSCSPQKEIIREVAPAKSQPLNEASDVVQEDLIALWKELNVGSKPNPGAAELILSTMNEATLQKLRSTALPESNRFLGEIASAKETFKRHLLLGSVPYFMDQQVISGTALYATDRLAISAERFIKALDTTKEAELQNRALKKINDTFEDRSLEIAKLYAPAVVQKMTAEDVKKIEGLTGNLQEMARDILPVLKKYDKILAGYNFHPDDRAKLLFRGLVASVIAKELAENNSLKNFMTTVLESKRMATLLSEVGGLLDFANKRRKQLQDDLSDISEAISGIGSDIQKLKDQANFGLTDQSKKEAQRLLSDLIYGRTKSVDGQGLLTQPLPLSPNVQRLVDGAENASKNIAGILKTATEISNKFGIKVDPGLAKALDTATKVAAGVSLARTLALAAASGGVIAALGAFSGGGGLSALGLGGGDPMAADIAAIKQQLEEIKETQKKIMEMQVETMKMIQSLAELIQSYHHEQMYVLRQIRAAQDVTDEIVRILEDKDLRACHAMIEFALQERTSTIRNAVDFLSIPRSMLYSMIGSRELLEHFVKSTTERTFEDCQEAVASAFKTSSSANGPLIFAKNKAETTLGPFYKDNYRPLANLWKRVSFSQSAFGAHLPAVDFTTLNNKIRYASAAPITTFDLDTDELISTEALERYVAVLLLLSPLTTFDKPQWQKLIDGNSLTGLSLSWKRNDDFLRNALRKTQSAIAQESLIAGEPLLNDLSSVFADILSFRSIGCDVLPKASETETLFCAVKGNPLLRENLLNFRLNKLVGSRFSELQYAQALASNDIASMEQVLGTEYKGRISKKTFNGKEVLAVDWNYETRNESPQSALPEIANIVAGRIRYSENLKRLLVLQQKLVDGILEITPAMLSTETQEDYLKVLAVKK